MVDGKDVARLRRGKVPFLRRQMGIIFQDFRLIPTMTVYENVAFAMHVTNIGKKDIKERVNYMLELVHLEDKAKVYPEFLSGGEQQRVAVARALAHSPRLVIADEPTGNIDPEMSLEMMELLERVSEMGITVLVVTHEHELVRRFNRRTITPEAGPHHLRCSGQLRRGGARMKNLYVLGSLPGAACATSASTGP